MIRAGTASLWVAPAAGDGTCFALRYGATGGVRACPPERWAGPPLRLGASTWGTETVWVSGRVRADVATVVVGRQRLRPVEGFLLAIVAPQRPLRAVALAADGRVLARTVLLR